MQWDTIRAQFPDQWVLIEAIKAHSQDGTRILDDIALIETFPDSVAAWHRYGQMHHDMPNRELVPIHTSRETIEIFERLRFGIRPR